MISIVEEYRNPTLACLPLNTKFNAHFKLHDSFKGGGL